LRGTARGVLDGSSDRGVGAGKSNHVWRNGRLGGFFFFFFLSRIDKIVYSINIKYTTCWKAEKAPVYSVLLLCTGGKAPRPSFATGSGDRIRAPFVLALVRVSGIVLYTCTSIFY